MQSTFDTLVPTRGTRHALAVTQACVAAKRDGLPCGEESEELRHFAAARGRRHSTPDRPIFDALQALNPLVTYDAGDPGAGLYYGELFFEGS